MPSKKKNASGSSNVIRLTGDLTISRAAEILSLLKESIQARDEIRISLQEVTRIDLSCLQLLCSAHRTAAAKSKVLTLETPVPDALRKLIRQAGFKRRNGCAFSPNTNCLCFDGGE